MKQHLNLKNDKIIHINNIFHNSECSESAKEISLKLYSKSEAAKLLGIRKSTLLTWIEKGELGSLQVGKRIKIPHLELEKFLENKTTRNIPIINPDFNKNNGSTNLDNEINSIIQGEY